MMRQANRLIEIIRSTRLQHAMLALFTLLVLGNGVIALRSIWHDGDRIVENVPTLGLALLIGAGVFALIAGGLAWLMTDSAGRQHSSPADPRQREDKLLEQSALLQNTLENMGEGLSVFDRNGRLVAWNSRFLELFELPPPRGATQLRDILLLQTQRGDFGPADDPESDASKRVERFFRNVPSQREWTSSSGRILHIRRRAMPDGAVVSVYSDITERKAAEEKMAQAWKAAELANRSKSDFLANMSHELRTPLNAIIGFSEVICSEFLGPMHDKKYLGYIHDIHSSGLHLLSIINDVLDMSKIEAGKLQLSSEIVTVQRVIAESLRMVGERAHSRNIELVSEVTGVDTGVWGDERAIKQIVLNLLSNAVKFSHDGGRVDIRTALDPAGGLVLEVEDRGIGMSAEELERALQPFGQANTGAARLYGGTGLGLPITKGLVEAHHGELVIDSAPGRGTLVRVTLPPNTAAAAAASTAKPRPPNEAHDDRAVA